MSLPSPLWQIYTMRIITYFDHAHLSETMKSDAKISITCNRHGIMGFCDYVLGADAYGQEQSQETMQHV